jgi:hypothetical protein
MAVVVKMTSASAAITRQRPAGIPPHPPTSYGLTSIF